MKRATSISMLLLFVITTSAQISISKSQGGTLNKGSSLVREYITLNDSTCPLLINPNVGVEPRYSNVGEYSLTADGDIFPNQPIVAYEIHHILYDVFGRHIKSLSNVEITDLESSKSIEGNMVFGRLFTYEAMVYCFCVSYVAKVRTMEGEMWSYDPSSIMLELKKNQIPYEEDYSPSKYKLVKASCGDPHPSLLITSSKN